LPIPKWADENLPHGIPKEIISNLRMLIALRIIHGQDSKILPVFNQVYSHRKQGKWGRIEGSELDFDRARRIATDQAKAYYGDAMLLSWYDGRHGRYSPHEVECCKEGVPSWVSYAKSRGGNLTIEINDEQYVFVFRGKQ
jgi:hypothetical protein